MAPLHGGDRRGELGADNRVAPYHGVRARPAVLGWVPCMGLSHSQREAGLRTSAPLCPPHQGYHPRHLLGTQIPEHCPPILALPTSCPLAKAAWVHAMLGTLGS